MRLIVGEAAEESQAATSLQSDKIVLLETNLDDTPGEQIGYCLEKLWQAGALDVSLTPLQMKKGRPGVLLAVQCPQEQADAIEAIIFAETTTLGLRRQVVERRTLFRQPIEVKTSFGSLRGTIATLPDGSKRFAPEYESCRQAATSADVPLADVYALAMTAYRHENEV